MEFVLVFNALLYEDIRPGDLPRTAWVTGLSEALPGAATAMKPRKGREHDASGMLTTDESGYESDGNVTGVAGATVSLWYESVDAVHAF